MLFRSIGLRKIALVSALLTMTGALLVPETATAAGQGALASAEGRSCVAAALRVVPPSVKDARVACTATLLTSTIPAGGGAKTLVTELASGKTVDVTGLGAAERRRSLAAAFSPDEDGPVRPMFGQWYIDDQYHAHTDENLFYAIVTNGQVTFISWVKLTSRVGLQFRNHYFNLSFVQLENRPIILTVNVRSREDISLWPDRTVQEDLYGNATYDTQRSEDGYLTTDDAGVFYWELADRRIDDQQHGRFDVIDDFEGPHYRCYVTVSCKYPNGKEA